MASKSSAVARPKHDVAPLERGIPTKIIHGVPPKRSIKPKRRLVPADPTTPGTGAGSFPNFLYQGGPVINTPQVYIAFVGDWTSSANQTRATRLTQFVKDLLSSSYMNILSQYGVGNTGTVENSVFLSNSTSPLTHSDLTGLIQTAINNSVLPEPNASTCVIMYLDNNTAVDDAGAGAVMCEATSDTAFGYHTFFATTAGNNFPFAVVPGLTDTCLKNSCPGDDAGCNLHLAQTQEQRQTEVTSHEFSEMITNPINTGVIATSNFAWIDLTDFGSGENGDICAGNSTTITVGSNTWTVQNMYSKLDDQQSNGATTCVSSESGPLASLLPAVSMILDRSTFGKDEVKAKLAAGSGKYQDAFYVVVDGYTPDELGLNSGNLTSPPNLPTFSGSFHGLGDPAIGFDGSTGVQLDQPGKWWNIQRITFPFNITFSTLNAFNGLSISNPSQIYGLTAQIVNSTTPAGYPTVTSPVSAIAEFELVFQADPYMTAGETWWLSDDIRVFQVTPAKLPSSNIPLAYSSTAYTGNNNAYIKNLIGELNKSFTDPTTVHTPFSGISSDEYLSAVNLAGKDLGGNPVFNFALARVHLQGDTAHVVRMFFRLFISSSPDTDFNSGTTFRSAVEADSAGNPISGTLIPMLGFVTSDMPSTIPFFAEARIDSTTESMARQTDDTNVQTIPSPTAPTPPTGSEVYAYFGCWLDLNQTTPRFPADPSSQTHQNGPYTGALPIPALIMSNHACLVAEIAYDPDPIPTGANASTSDKINQRNLQWSPGDNPGPATAHRIPTLFDVRPSTNGSPDVLPDELMIEWGNTPPGSVATIYWPQVNADDVLALDTKLYTSKNLTKKDAHTIQCVTGNSVTYVPIPAGTGPSLAGLMTVDLPTTVRVDEEFNVVVRRIRWARQGQSLQIQDRARSDQTVNWRYVVGAFQIQIPIGTGPALLPQEESLLALFKWKIEQIPTTNKWHPVLNRYIEIVSGRVSGFGGNPGQINPSPGGYPGTLGQHHEHPHGHACLEWTGKVSGLVYDRFGDFDAFILETESGHEHRFIACEQEIECLVRYAWDERAVISVFAEHHRKDWPVSIVLRRAPKGI